GVVEQSRDAEVQLAAVDRALERARYPRQRVVGDRDRDAADRVVHDLVVLEDRDQVRVRGAADRDAEHGSLRGDGVAGPGAREGRRVDAVDAVARRAARDDLLAVDELTRDREAVHRVLARGAPGRRLPGPIGRDERERGGDERGPRAHDQRLPTTTRTLSPTMASSSSRSASGMFSGGVT